MSRRFLFRFLSILIFGCSFAGVAQAEDEKDRAEGVEVKKIQIQVVGEQAEPRGGLVVRLSESATYWLGLALEMEDGHLEVAQVLPESPAAKAGLKPEDVLVAIGETTLKEVADLQKLVKSSGGKPLALKVRREGKELIVEVKPERRAEGQTLVIGEEAANKKGEGEQLQLRLQALTDQVHKQGEAAKVPPTSGWQVMSGASVLGNMPVPEDLEVTIRKKGNKPTRIKVRLNEHSWTVGEHELDKLPEPIRGHVARMMPGRTATMMMMPWAPLHPQPAFATPMNPAAPLNPAPLNPDPWNRLPAAPAPAVQDGIQLFRAPVGGAPGQPVPGPATARPVRREEGGEMQKELQQLKHQLLELREQVEILRKK